MTYIYEFNDKEYTLEELIEENDIIKKTWAECINEEYNFWNKINPHHLSDIITEATDLLEETLMMEHSINIKFIKTTDEYDLNVLLMPLIK